MSSPVASASDLWTREPASRPDRVRISDPKSEADQQARLREERVPLGEPKAEALGPVEGSFRFPPPRM